MSPPRHRHEHGSDDCFNDAAFVNRFLGQMGDQVTYSTNDDTYDIEEVERLTGLTLEQSGDLCHAVHHMFKHTVADFIDQSGGDMAKFKQLTDEELEGTFMMLLLLGTQLGRREMVYMPDSQSGP